MKLSRRVVLLLTLAGVLLAVPMTAMAGEDRGVGVELGAEVDVGLELNTDDVDPDDDTNRRDGSDRSDDINRRDVPISDNGDGERDKARNIRDQGRETWDQVEDRASDDDIRDEIRDQARCLRLADSPRRCVDIDFGDTHNIRHLIWRLVNAHEWRLLVRLLLALGWL